MSERNGAASGGRSELHVLFQVADANYVVPASSVLHMESYEGATLVPGTPDFVEGLVQIRGSVVPVVDLRKRFERPAHQRSIDDRVIVVRCGERTVGLHVDRSREVLHLAPDRFRPPPELVARTSKGFVKAVAEAGERLVMLIDCERVIGEEIEDGD